MATRKKYRVIKQIAEHKFSGIDATTLLSRPEMAPFIEELLLNGERKRCSKDHTDLQELLCCYYHVWNNQGTAKNRALPAEVLSKLRYKDFANPRIWDLYKNDFDKLDKELVHRLDFLKLCSNVRAIPYIELHLDRLDPLNTDQELRCLFANPAAVHFIVSQNLSDIEMLEYGAKYEHLFPYFNKDLCKEYLKSIRRKGVVAIGLIHNPAAAYLIRECITDLISEYRVADIIICRYKHHIPLILDNINWLNCVHCRSSFNKNEGAVEFLKQNPNYIMPGPLLSNGKAVDLIIDLIENCESPVVKKYYVSEFNRLPGAIPYLLTHPELITDSILFNPNIFEEDITAAYSPG